MKIFEKGFGACLIFIFFVARPCKNDEEKKEKKKCKKKRRHINEEFGIMVFVVPMT